MKILFIGCNSFICFSLIKYIDQIKIFRPDLKLFLVSRSNLRNELIHHIKNFKKIDLNIDNKKLIKLIKNFKPNVILNFSAQSIVQESWKYPLDWFQTNLLSNVELLDYLKNTDFVDRYVQSSTPEVYGFTKGKIKENFQYSPSTPYATSKASIDFLLKNYHDSFSFPVIFSRIANIFGPGQQVFKIIPKTIISIKKKIKIPIQGEGLSKRSFIYSDDVSDALFKILNKGKVGQIYHISENKLITIKDLVKKICKIMSVNFNKSVFFVSERIGKDPIYELNSKKIRKQLNWKPKINLDKGIIKTINWVDNNFKKLKNVKLNYEHKK
jgi:dTDP-glucose 4,6-dehydratase